MPGNLFFVENLQHGLSHPLVRLQKQAAEDLDQQILRFWTHQAILLFVHKEAEVVGFRHRLRLCSDQGAVLESPEVKQALSILGFLVHLHQKLVAAFVRVQFRVELAGSAVDNRHGHLRLNKTRSNEHDTEHARSGKVPEDGLLHHFPPQSNHGRDHSRCLEKRGVSFARSCKVASMRTVSPYCRAMMTRNASTPIICAKILRLCMF